ncbi:TPA: hypothetical protein N2D99_001967 [Clostridium botulinum]|nr:hypothetical protein [Clostridium botulinum]
MKSIVKLEWDNELTIKESVKIIDHSECYEIEFKKSSNDLVRKDLYGSIPFVSGGTWKNTLYINGTKYHSKPEYYINLVKTWRKKNDCRKWLKSS